MDLIFHLGSTGIFLARVVEDTGAFKFRVLNELQEFIEIGLGFTREPHNEGRADGDAGNAGTDAFDEIADVGTVGLALHEAQHAVADVLQRHVDVTGDFGALSNGLDEVVTPVRRMCVKEADPKIAFELIELTNE